jgi:hypothetical protein
VQFMDGSTSLGSPVSLVNGTATLAASMLSPGNHAIKAIYSGDANNPSSTSQAFTQVVSESPTVSQAIPTMSEWGLMLLSGLVGLGALLQLRRV